MSAPPANHSLSYRLALKLSLAFVLTASVLLLCWGAVSQFALKREHEAASLRMAALFEASLRNAMIKRDLGGLQQLVEKLGELPGVRAAAVLEPGGQVRFSSTVERLNQYEPQTLSGMCLKNGCAPLAKPLLQWRDGGEGQSLRVTYPVLNGERCAQCHGAPQAHPVNGVLVLDLRPMASEQAARSQFGTWLLPLSLLGLTFFGLATLWILRREVLRPVAALSSLMQRFAAGDAQARSGAQGGDEMARLARGFDRMADEVQRHLDAQAAQGRFLQSLIDASPDAMLVLREDHTIAMANVGYGRLLGVRPEQVLGQTCHRTSRAQAEPCPTTLVNCPLTQCHSDALAGGGAAMRTVMTFTTASGQPVSVEIHAAALRDGDGRRLVLEVIRPLDDQVRFSQEQRLSAIGLLANGVAHEIHNPLASIRLALQSSLRGLRDNSIDRAELIDYLRLVDEQIDRCVLITQRLLRLSQPSAQDAQPVRVRTAVDDVLALLAEEMARQRVGADVDIEPTEARVLMDEGELRQVIVNVVQNAIHAMPDGGRLVLRGQPLAQGRYRITVSDTGVGIALDKQPLIFLPFYSLRADGRRGTGLGLAICKALLEQRGGSIAVHSQPGVGSRFIVELPNADPPPAGSAPAATV